MAEIKDWSKTASSNNSSPPDGAPEGMLPSAVNNVIRENMASVRTWYEDVEWINYGHSGTQDSGTTLTIPTDVTATYTANRAIKIADASTLYGFIVSAVYSAPNTTITVELLTGSLTSSMNGETIALGAIKPHHDALPKNYKYGLHVYAADAGTNDTYAITVSPHPIAYETGMIFHFKANTANTGAATLNVNSIGAIPIKKDYDRDLADHDIKARQIVSVIYDGTNFQMISPVSNSGGLSNIIADTTPQLGGSLDVNGHKMVSTANGNIDIEPNGTGNVLLGNYTFDADQPVGAGQDNYVLTYDNAGGLISLKAVSGGNAPIVSSDPSSVSESDLILPSTSSYQFILIAFSLVPATDGATLRMLTSTDGGSTFDSGSNDYSWHAQYNSFGSNSVTGSQSDTSLNISGTSVGSGTGEGIDGILVLVNPSHTSQYQRIFGLCGYHNTAGNAGNIVSGGARDSASDVDALRFYFSTGNIESGRIRIYGYPNA